MVIRGYLTGDAWRLYKSGERNHAIMTAMATMLTDEEISDLAKYFSKQEAIVYVKK